MTMLDPHLDVDQLSAAVDGERDAAVAAHLLTCLTCREQVETWRRSLAQLRALDTGPTPEARPAADRALAAAMAALPRTVARSQRRMRLAGIAASVAAVCVAAGIVVGVAHLGGGGASNTSGGSSAGASSSKSASNGAAGSPSHGASSGGASPHAPLARPTSGVGSSSSQSGTSTQATSVVAGGKVALTTELRRLVRRQSSFRPVPAGTPCEHKARLLASVRVSGPTPPTLSVPVTYQGVRGQVFVFSRGHGYLAFVLRSSSCDLLTTVTF